MSNLSDCPDCARLARDVEILRRIDYRACAEKGQELIAHQLSCHIWHVATAKDSRFSANGITCQNAENGEQSQEI